MTRADEFLEMVGRQTDECVTWPHGSTRRENGYPRLFFAGRRWAGHRLALELTVGPAPSGHQAAHSCGDSMCINPRHLRWATVSDNARDRTFHGTQRSQKLSVEDIEEIRRLGSEPDRVSDIDLGVRFGVGREHIHRIRTGRRWMEQSDR